MATNQNKTHATQASVDEFLNLVPNKQKKEDGLKVLKMMKEITGLEPRMWGPSMIGFGNYHYKYESGREGDMFQVGFSPRKSALTLYVLSSSPKLPTLLEKLGKHTIGKSCLYINKLSDIDESVLREIIELAYTTPYSRPS